jgi:hypothetical protein
MKDKYNSSNRRMRMTTEAGDRMRKHTGSGLSKAQAEVGFGKTKSEDSLKGVKVVSPFNLSPNF